jgi:succinate dehydrogenase flavin-adding protein (antitoxin of CptAB toxin-antitoxin module)
MSGCYVWTFPWREVRRGRFSAWRGAFESDAPVMAWELRLNTPTDDLQLAEWEKLFDNSEALDAYLSQLKVQWLQGKEADVVRKRYFPLR